MKFLHAADLHIDSPLLGLDRLEGAPADEIRAAPRVAFRRLIDTALAEDVAFVVLAGDIFDGPWKDISTGLFFCRELDRIKHIPVFAVLGNHDSASTIVSALPWPKHVHRFSADRAESVTLPDLGVVLHGQSFATKAVDDDLAAGFPEAMPGLHNIGVLHTSLGGYAAHATYAPTSLAVLHGKRYDVWCLGHVHERQIVSTDPLVLFPGNIQGRHINEPGARGCMIIDDASGRFTARFVELDSLRWQTVIADVTTCRTLDEACGVAAAAIESATDQQRTWCVRVRFEGHSEADGPLRADEDAVRAALTLDAAGLSVWIESVVIRTQPARVRDRDLGENDLARAVFSAFARARETGDLRDRILAELVPVQQKFARDFVDTYALSFTAGAAFGEILDDARALLAAKFGE